MMGWATFFFKLKLPGASPGSFGFSFDFSTLVALPNLLPRDKISFHATKYFAT
jgi:hypothetical protein